MRNIVGAFSTTNSVDEVKPTMSSDEDHDDHPRQHRRHDPAPKPDAADAADAHGDEVMPPAVAASSTSAAAPAGAVLRRDLARDADGGGASHRDGAQAVKTSPWYAEYIPYIIALCIALLLIWYFFSGKGGAEGAKA
jgi:hypothetical protein